MCKVWCMSGGERQILLDNPGDVIKIFDFGLETKEPMQFKCPSRKSRPWRDFVKIDLSGSFDFCEWFFTCILRYMSLWRRRPFERGFGAVRYGLWLLEQARVSFAPHSTFPLSSGRSATIAIAVLRRQCRVNMWMAKTYLGMLPCRTKHNVAVDLSGVSIVAKVSPATTQNALAPNNFADSAQFSSLHSI